MALISVIAYWLAPFLSLCLVAYWLNRKYVYRNFPPGPRGWPLVGYLPFLGERPHETLFQLSKQYGSLYGLSLGMQKVAVLGDWRAVEEALVHQGELFAGRPEVFCFDSMVKKRDVVTTHGPVSKTQRKFMLQTLRTMGFGSTVFEDTLARSTDQLCDTLEKYNGRHLFLDEHFFRAILNITWKVAANRDNTDDNDEFARSFFTVVKENFKGLRGDHVLNFMPYLRHIVPGAFGYWTFTKNFQKLWDYLGTELDEHSRTYREGERRDIIDCHLEEMKREVHLNNKKQVAPPFNTPHVIGSIYDIFLGGTDTSTNSLLWGILFLILHPEIQDKIREELNSIVGSGRRPSLSDKSNLPYMEAFFMELQRVASLAPLSLLHTPLKDANLLGFRIPRGTKVIQNIYAVHNDPKLWGDPEVFRPERFLDAETNTIKKVPYFIPFSIGRRSCPGEQLARYSLFFIFSHLIQKFQFSIPPNSPRPTTVPIVTLTSSPSPFPVSIQVIG